MLTVEVVPLLPALWGGRCGVGRMANPKAAFCTSLQPPEGSGVPALVPFPALS